MPVSNTTDSYGSVARMIHWLMALLVISMIPLGIRANVLAHQIEAGATEPAILSQAQLLFSLHKTIGVGIFFLALVRILWALTNPKPNLGQSLPFVPKDASTAEIFDGRAGERYEDRCTQ